MGEALFSPRTVIWMVLVGVVSFCAFVALSAYAPDLRTGSDGGAHALSKSAVGFAGLAELLREEGAPVQISRGALPGMKNRQGLLILTPTPFTAPKEIAGVRFWGPVLVVLPKWAVIRQPLNKGWVDKAGELPPETVTRSLAGLAASTRIERRKGVSRPALLAAKDQSIFSGDGKLGEVEALQTISGPDWVPLLVDEQGKTVIARSRKQPVFVLSDPDILNTQGLKDPTTARTASEVVSLLRGDRPVFFDVTLNGFKRGRSLLRLALEPPLLGVTACLLAAAAMMGLHAVARFGPPARQARALALGAQTLADNSAALVRMARREHRMAEPYAALTRDAVARAVGAPRDLDPGQLDALLDRLSAGRGAAARFSQLMAAAQGARTDGELMRAARGLFQWRMEMTRDGR
jgi:hypothetical protein